MSGIPLTSLCIGTPVHPSLFERGALSVTATLIPDFRHQLKVQDVLSGVEMQETWINKVLCLTDTLSTWDSLRLYTKVVGRIAAIVEWTLYTVNTHNVWSLAIFKISATNFSHKVSDRQNPKQQSLKRSSNSSWSFVWTMHIANCHSV